MYISKKQKSVPVSSIKAVNAQAPERELASNPPQAGSNPPRAGSNPPQAGKLPEDMQPQQPPALEFESLVPDSLCPSAVPPPPVPYLPQLGSNPPQAGSNPPPAGNNPPPAGNNPPQAGNNPPPAGSDPPRLPVPEIGKSQCIPPITLPSAELQNERNNAENETGGPEPRGAVSRMEDRRYISSDPESETPLPEISPEPPETRDIPPEDRNALSDDQTQLPEDRSALSDDQTQLPEDRNAPPGEEPYDEQGPETDLPPPPGNPAPARERSRGRYNPINSGGYLWNGFQWSDVRYNGTSLNGDGIPSYPSIGEERAENEEPDIEWLAEDNSVRTRFEDGPAESGGGSGTGAAVRTAAQSIPAQAVPPVQNAPGNERTLTYDQFIAENPGIGVLRIQAFGPGQSYPIQGVRVSVGKPFADGEHVFYRGVTNCSGVIDGIVLPAPGRASDAPRPYAEYSITAEHPYYEERSYNNIPVFTGITTIQPVQLTLRTADN